MNSAAEQEIESEAGATADEPSVAALTTEGIARASAGDVAGALAAFEQAAAREPNAAQHRNVGVALVQLGRREEAIAAFRRAIDADAAYGDAHRLLAEALRLEGRVADAIEVMQRAVRVCDPPAMLADIATLLRQENRPAEAAIYLEQAVRSAGGNDVRLLCELGLSRLQAGDAEGAAADLQAALDADPRDVHAHAYLAVVLDRLGRQAEAIAAYEQALLLHRARPHRWPAERDVARIGLMYEASVDGLPDSSYLDLPSAGQGKLLTVLVGCYGDYANYSLRCLASIADARGFTAHCNLLIGLNACCAETVAAADRLISRGVATAVVRSTTNINKDPMMRLLIEQVRTPYLLWLDDDSHWTDLDWPQRLSNWIRENHPFDVAGEAARWGPNRGDDARYMRFIRGRPWWRGDAYLPPDLREWVPFVVGGLFIARTQYLRRHDFPDRGIVKAMDDVALGELLLQQGGRMVGLPADLRAMARISDGDRRGENFDLPQV